MRLRSPVLIGAVGALAIFGAGSAVETLSARALSDSLSAAAQARFAVSLDQVRRSLEAEVTLGSPLTALTSADARFESVMTASNIQAIELFDANGVILLSTDVSYIGDLAAESDVDAFIADASSAAPSAYWTVDKVRGADPTIGMHVRNAHDAIIGAVTLSFAARVVGGRVAAIREDARMGVLALSLLGGVAAFLAALAFARRSARAPEGVDRLFDGAADDVAEDARAAHDRLREADRLLTALIEGLRRDAR